MATRGVLGYITFDADNNDFVFNVSTQFNGDMGDDMYQGKKSLSRLKDVKTPDDFNKVIVQTIKDFGYEDEYSSLDDFSFITKKTFTQESGSSKENPYSVSSNLDSVFHYSDYEYIMNFSGKMFWFHDNDENKTFPILPDGKEVFIFCFGHFIGKLNCEKNLLYIKKDE